jgi:branched-chain amino acid transport system substrate-binding protein
MKKVSRILFTVVFLFFSIVLINSLGYAKKSVKTVKLGSSMALSGGASFWGVGYDNAYRLAAKKINAAGGFTVKGQKYNWEVVSCDQKYNTTEAVSCVNKLIYKDKVKYLATLGGAPSIAVAPISGKNNVLQICWAAGGKALTNPKNPLVFRHSPNDVSAAQFGLYKWLKEKEGIKSVATLHPDDETGYSAGEGCNQAAENAGLKMLAQEYFSRETVDFYPLLSRIMAKKPDCIDMAICGFRTEALIAKQLHELKYKGVVLLWTVDPVKAIKVVGPDALEGMYSYLTLAHMITPEQKEFKNDYVAAYGEWNEQSLLAYDLLFTLTECIVEAQSFDPEKIANIMQDKVINYLYGKGRYGMEKKFGIKRQGMYPTPLAQFKNGKWHHVKFIDPDTPK